MRYRGRAVDPVAAAWAAGFLEADGCFYVRVRRGGRFVTPMISAAQCDPAPLLRLQKMFGGAIRKASEATGNRRESWHWELSGANAVGAALVEIVEHLTKWNKAKQAKILLQLCNSIDPSAGGGRKPSLTDSQLQFRERCANEIKALKR